jgi:hypothetical protein
MNQSEYTNGDKKAKQLLHTALKRLPVLQALLTEASSHWGYEDPIYRLYHHFQAAMLQGKKVS